MAEERQTLAGQEQEIVAKALFEMVRTYPHFPDGVKAVYGDVQDDSICVIPTQGAVYTRKYIGGGFEAQFPYFLRFRTSPTTNQTRITRGNALDKLAQWLIETEKPELTDGRRITDIMQEQTTYIVAKYEDGSIDYQTNMRLIYKKKGTL